MSVSPHDLLCHIFDEISFITKETRSLTKEKFLADPKAKRAFVRSLEIIGEAVKNLPDQFKSRHPEIRWKEMARMRDRLIHHYFGVDYIIVWDTVSEDIPKLRIQIEDLINKTNPD